MKKIDYTEYGTTEKDLNSLIISIALKWAPSFPGDKQSNIDDLVNDAWEEILNKIGKCKEKQAFIQFAIITIRNRFTNLLKKANRTPKTVNSDLLLDHIEATPTGELDTLMMAKLNDIEKKVVELRFLHDLTYHEISKRVDMSKTSVYFMLKEIVETFNS